jgi:hypothetical protein
MFDSSNPSNIYKILGFVPDSEDEFGPEEETALQYLAMERGRPTLDDATHALEEIWRGSRRGRSVLEKVAAIESLREQSDYSAGEKFLRELLTDYRDHAARFTTVFPWL